MYVVRSLYKICLGTLHSVYTPGKESVTGAYWSQRVVSLFVSCVCVFVFVLIHYLHSFVYVFLQRVKGVYWIHQVFYIFFVSRISSKICLDKVLAYYISLQSSKRLESPGGYYVV